MKSRLTPALISHPRGAVSSSSSDLQPPAPVAGLIAVERKIERIALAEIVTGSGHRLIDNHHVEVLAQSIDRIGLTTPIFVVLQAGAAALIAGQHRVEAVRRLGQTHIDAIVLDSNEPKNRLLTISENLHRLGYSALERAEAENEWLQAFEGEGGQDAQPSGGHQPNDKGVSKTSRALEVSRRELQRAKRIAGISPEAKLRARELGLHQKQSALLRIAEGTTAQDQLNIVSEIAERKRQPRKPKNKVSDTGSKVDGPAPPDKGTPARPPQNDVEGMPGFLNRRDPERAFQELVAAWNAASQLKLTWADAPPASQSRFVAEVLCIVPSEQSEEVSHVH